MSLAMLTRNMLRRTSVRAFASSASNFTAGKDSARKLSPEEAKAEAAKLAIQSLKDVGSVFSSGSDDAVQPIDTRPVFENPELFGTLNLLHQGQVLKELQEKYDKNWNKLTDEEKKLGYYIAYGNWGPREKFINWNTQEAPYDLPFRVPSKVRLSNPQANDVVHKLEPLYLSETPVRKEQFDTSKMDPVTKTFIYITLFVMLFAILRDKNTGESGKPQEIIIEDRYMKSKLEKEQKEKEKEIEEENRKNQEKQARRKWYYLWLK